MKDCLNVKRLTIQKTRECENERGEYKLTVGGGDEDNP